MGKFYQRSHEKSCHLLRVVALEALSWSRKKRFHFMMVLSDINDGNETKTSENRECSASRCFWFGFALSLLRIPAFQSTNPLYSGRKHFDFVDHDTKVSQQLCSVHWFDVLNYDEQPIDKIDKTVNCVRFRWIRPAGGQISFFIACFWTSVCWEHFVTH